MKPSDALAKAKDVLLSKGWGKGGLTVSEPGPNGMFRETHCALGAMCMANEMTEGEMVAEALPPAQLAAVYEALPEEYQIPGRHLDKMGMTILIRSIYTYNDDPAIKESEVLDVFDRATIIAKEKYDTKETS